MKPIFFLIACYTLFSSHSYAAEEKPIDICQRKMMSLSDSGVINVPEVSSTIVDEKRYIFYWGPQTSLISTNKGEMRGYCTLHRDTGKGKVSINNQSMDFSMWE